jgi:hypothetical protein
MPLLNQKMSKPLKINWLTKNKEKRKNFKIFIILPQHINSEMKLLIKIKISLKYFIDLTKTRIKPDSLPNPHMMSEHDQRPQFAIEQDMK